MGLSFRGQLARLRDNAADVDDAYNDFLDRRIDETAAYGEARMKAAAPWRDDVDGHRDRVAGAARAALHTAVEDSESHKTIRFSHGVDYGIWLEVNENGKNQIIMPTVAAAGRQLMESLRGTLSALQEE